MSPRCLGVPSSQWGVGCKEHSLYEAVIISSSYVPEEPKALGPSDCSDVRMLATFSNGLIPYPVLSVGFRLNWTESLGIKPLHCTLDTRLVATVRGMSFWFSQSSGHVG